jgi:hypothetical protein
MKWNKKYYIIKNKNYKEVLVPAKIFNLET